ncbi:MAG: Arm DNA-binding domain-containing protein, partial [Lutibacter sp.]
MKIHNINLLFVLSSSRKRKDGKAILYCRITYLKKRSQFSTGLFINPKLWNNKHQKAEPPNDETEFVNSQLSLIKSKINKAFLLLQVQEGNFTVDDIYTLYKGKKTTKEYNTVEYFE